MKNQIKEIIKKLKTQIKDCKEYKEDLDKASWGYEIGILITANEAQGIIDYIKQLEERKEMKIEIKELLDANTVRITTPDERWYQYPQTKEWLPSSTWICDYVPKNKYFNRWLAEKGLDESERIKKEAGDKGSRVHHAIELLSLGKEVYHNDSLPDSEGEHKEITAEEYEAIMSFYDWAKEMKPKFLKSEQTVFNKKIGYAGTLDCVAEIDCKIYIIDFKTSKEIYLPHEVQISSYRHCDGIKADKIAILQLGYGKNKKGFKFTEIQDKFDLFLSAYNFWSEENANKQPRQKDYPRSLRLELQ